MLKPWKCKVFQIVKCLSEPLLKNSIQTIFQGGTPWVTEILNNVIVSMVLYCAPKNGVKKTQNLLSTFLWIKLVHSCPFTLESHIYVKALKTQVFQIIGCLIKPFLKSNTQTIFQGGTPWVAEILNNVIVSMALYCAQKLLGWFFGFERKTNWK